MTPHLMLDTSAVSAVVKGRAETLSAMLDEQSFCISVVTEAELRFGLARRPVHAGLRGIVEGFLRTVGIRPWTSACAEQYARLRTELEARGKPLAPMDLLIAAHVMAEECTLVSADRVFAQVPGLAVLDWSAVGAPKVQQEPAQLLRAKPPRPGTRQGDMDEAVAYARSAVRPKKTEAKAGRKPRPR